LTTRNFFRRVNRGLVLAGILFIGLILYLAIGAAMFQSEIPVIEKMIHDYAEAAEDLMILPEEHQNPSVTVPMAVIDAKIKESEPILRQYLTDVKVTQWGRPALRTVATAQKDALESNRKARSFVTDAGFQITGVKRVRRVSSNLAIADIEVRTEIDTIGSPDYILFLQQEWGRGDWDHRGPDMMVVPEYPNADKATDTFSDSDAEAETGSITQRVTFRDVYLKKIDGTWKISETSGSWWYH